MKASKLAIVALALVGCGPGNVVNGTVAGKQIAVQDAVLYVQRDNTGKIASTAVILVDRPNFCTNLKANRFPQSASFLSMGLGRRGASGVSLTPDVGDYTVTSGSGTSEGKFAAAFFDTLDANCVGTLPLEQSLAKSGIIHVGNLQLQPNGVAAGTFDLSFGSDRVTGAFNAPYCESPLTTTPSCE